MMIEKMPIKREKPKKSWMGRYVRATIGLGVMVFVIAFFVTMAANSSKKLEPQKNYALVMPTWNPPTLQPIVDLVADTRYVVQEDDAPEIKPVSAPILEWSAPARGEVMTSHSEDELVYNRTMEDWRVHLGADYSGNVGASVMAAADGEVVEVGQDEEWGNYIVISHADGFKSKYCNLQDNPPVKKGDKVKKGQVIAGMDRTANSEIADPPHLHFEVWLGKEIIDPADLF